MLGGRCAPSHLDAAPGVRGRRLLPLFREGNPEIRHKRCQPGAGWVVRAGGWAFHLEAASGTPLPRKGV